MATRQQHRSHLRANFRDILVGDREGLGDASVAIISRLKVACCKTLEDVAHFGLGAGKEAVNEAWTRIYETPAEACPAKLKEPSREQTDLSYRQISTLLYRHHGLFLNVIPVQK